MTLTLEIPSEIERAAAASQTDVSTFLVTAGLEKAATVIQPSSAERKRAAAMAGLGALAGTPRTVDDFLADRHAEGEAEYDKWAARQKDAA